MPLTIVRAIVAVAGLAALSFDAARAASDSISVNAVATLAGGGSSGIVDGVGSGARFMQPSGIAVAPDGTIYLSDQSAQRLRAIAPDGTVTTLAGGGAPDATNLYVPGAYRDGAAADARFDSPRGIAVGRDGALYIADTLNHCIRRYASGMVTTFAGGPARIGKADGPLANASFTNPTDVKFDARGDAFVADFGIGVREISIDGTVSTLATPGIEPTITGLSIGEDADARTLFVANGKQGIGVVDLATGAARFENALEGAGSFGTPFAVRALSPYDGVFVDARSHTVRYFRTSHLPQLSRSFVRVIAGGASEAPEANAGYADGPSVASRFDVPSAIDLAPSGAYLVADARNRAVRRVPAVDRRGPVLKFSDFDAPPSAYRIAYLSASLAFWDSLWPDSVAGVLERRLTDDAPRFGLARTPHVYAIRLDGASTKALRSYAEQLLSQGVVDYVIVHYSIAFVNIDASQDPNLEAQAAWTVNVATQLRGMRDTLARSDVKLLVVHLPVWSNAAPAEMLYAREVFVPQNYDPNFATADALREAIHASGVPTLDETDDIWKYERRANHVPLYQTVGPHQTPEGNRFTADAIATYLEKTRPWSSP